VAVDGDSIMSRTMSKPPPDDPDLAPFVWRRAGGRCEWCGITPELAAKYSGELQLVHVKPWVIASRRQTGMPGESSRNGSPGMRLAGGSWPGDPGSAC
jgi:hypothetical protein